MIDWQPIETAPKDGTDVLVYIEMSGDSFVHLAFWIESTEELREIDDSPSGWWSYCRTPVSRELLDEYRTPTHWAPFNKPEKK